MKNRESVSSFLLRHAAMRPVSFHMPGHKGSAIYRRLGYGNFLDNIMDCDITEIPGADNLFQQEDVILEVTEKYKKLYDSKKTYLLVNGSSTGIIASILSLVNRGEKLIMARNCHKSVFNAVSLGGIEPVYLYPEISEHFDIQGEVSPTEVERLLEENPEARAVIITSPNYYGVCSDVAKIAEICHRKGSYLIVDQAHGAHLKFMDELKKKSGIDDVLGFESIGSKSHLSEGIPKICGFPHMSAELSGADLVINSTHKTLASFTQTAVLNVMNDDIDLQTVEDKLQTLQSSSPSYLLLASLDINADMMLKYGHELMREWCENVDRFYKCAENIGGLKLVKADRLDRTKINIDMSACGLNGNELEELMMKEGIFAELATGNILMCMTGIGNTAADYDRLLGFLKDISAKTHYAKNASSNLIETKRNTERAGKVSSDLIETKNSPGRAGDKEHEVSRAIAAPASLLERREIPAKKELIDIRESEGRVCAASLIPYPPGIPVICPGEVMTAEIIEYVINLRKSKEKVIGLDEKNRIAVGRL